MNETAQQLEDTSNETQETNENTDCTEGTCKEEACDAAENTQADNANSNDALENSSPAQAPSVSSMVLVDPRSFNAEQQNYLTLFLGKYSEIESLLLVHPAMQSDGWSYSRRCLSIALQSLEASRDQVVRAISLHGLRVKGDG